MRGGRYESLLRQEVCFDVSAHAMKNMTRSGGSQRFDYIDQNGLDITVMPVNG